MDYLQDFKKEYKDLKVKRTFKESVEPEEIFLDAEKETDFPDQKIETPLRDRIFFIFSAIIVAGLIILGGRVGYYQIVKGTSYSALSERNSDRSYPIDAPRGLIYDRNMTALVSNVPSLNIFLTPQDLPKSKIERDNEIEKICSVLGLNLKIVDQQLADFNFEKEQRILLVSSLSPEKMLELESQLKDLSALSIDNGVARQYNYGLELAHVLGYTGKLTSDDMISHPDYSSEERVGKSGLEAQYEEYLRGQSGERKVEVDAKGRQVQETGIKDPLAGQNIVTTIDLGLQEKMYEVLNKILGNLKQTKAVAVAMDPQTGQILGMVSLPSYDDNLFEQTATSTDFEKLWSDPEKPMFDRVISGQYAPGSTLKPMMGSAALQENVVTPETTVFDTGAITVVNQFNPGIVYRYEDWRALGTVNMYTAIAMSSDVYFYTVGGGYGNISGLGVDRIDRYLNLFGLGNLTGIDLPGEQPGLVPSPDWKQKTKNEPWFIGDTYHLSIGQGDLLVTPLQMAAAISVIANGGKLYTPYLVDKIADSDKNSIKVFSPQIKRQDFIKPEVLNVIRQGMRQAVTAGTVRALDSLPVTSAGKTGTAQIAGQPRENAWYVGFAPFDNPQITLAVMFENAGEGSSYAVPAAKEILNYYFTK